MKLKVCHISSAHDRYDIRIFEKECVSLASNGYDVTLIVNDDRENEIRKGVKIVSTKFKQKNRLDRLMNGKRHIFNKAVEVDADIFHFHDPELLPVGLKLLDRGKKVIYDSHEDVPRQILAKEWIPTILRRLISKLFEGFENYCAQKLTCIVTPTPFIENRFKKINKCVVQISNFPLIKEFISPPYTLENRTHVCYIGGISINRGIKQMIHAMQDLNITLELAGKFETEDLKNEVMREAKNINYYGYLDREQIISLLNSSILGLVTLLRTPNHIYSYPIKMFEYMAAGIPVIASNFELWREIVDKNKCGICVNPYNIEEITKAIKYIIEHPDEAKKMGENGRMAVMRDFNWRTQERKLLDLYMKL